MKRCLCCIVHFVGLVLLKRDAVVLESGSIDIDIADKRCGAAMPRDVIKEKLPSFVHSITTSSLNLTTWSDQMFVFANKS